MKFDLAPIENSEARKVIVSRAEAALAYASDLVIKKSEDEESAAKSLLAIATLKKDNKKIQDLFVKPLKDHIKALDGYFKPSTDVLTKADQIIREKLSRYQTELARKAAQKKEKILERVQQGTMDLNKATDKMAQVDLPHMPQRSDAGTVTYTTKKEVTIVDESKLPRDYLVPDLTKIRKVALAGILIPGVEVTEIKVPVARAY